MVTVFVIVAAICFSSSFQQYTSSSSFQREAEILFAGALLLLIVSIGLLLKKAWVRVAWGGTLLYFVAVTLYVYIIPMLHSGADYSLIQWFWLFSFLSVPLLLGLVLLKYLSLMLKG